MRILSQLLTKNPSSSDAKKKQTSHECFVNYYRAKFRINLNIENKLSYY